MKDGVLEVKAFRSYVDALRAGSRDPYVAYRVYETYWKLGQTERDLVRQAVLVLIEADPWFLASDNPLGHDCLEPDDLERLVDRVGVGCSPSDAAMLRAYLFYGARRYHVDEVAFRAQSERALTHLEQVPVSDRDRKWHEVRLRCLHAIDYDRYVAAVPTLLRHASRMARVAGAGALENDRRSL